MLRLEEAEVPEPRPPLGQQLARRCPGEKRFVTQDGRFARPHSSARPGSAPLEIGLVIYEAVSVWAGGPWVYI